MSHDPRMVEPQRVAAGDGPGDEAPYDPLRLCIFATVALIAWLLGPVAVVGFAAVGFAGYWRARRAGLLRSRCKLGDTRIVLVYLAAVAAVGAAGIALGWWVW
ncbi:hypothetical protein SAMN05192576_0570 [Nocardioides szechwanensis]|uniref:Uncharacterized protein n=1 Tax=Nocardioides szechwanensis TaxID=1005944 RepID=A0A1G9UW41_9ACTN|nr:hypothetical protein [Nocardioides szechwanensis]SDM64158.1 hypothetical protein SAMN05192576_0570 [Nocardioides szechwanensis]